MRHQCHVPAEELTDNYEMEMEFGEEQQERDWGSEGSSGKFQSSIPYRFRVHYNALYWRKITDQHGPLKPKTWAHS
jgi:hypothetical protein